MRRLLLGLGLLALVTLCQAETSGVLGRPVGELKLRDMSGRLVGLEEIRAHSSSGVVSATWWCSTCGSCRKVEKPLNQLAQSMARRAAIIAIDSNRQETPTAVKAQQARAGVSFPVYFDPGGRLAEQLGVRVTTTTVVLDKDGVVRYQGRFNTTSESYAADAVSALLAGRDVPVAQTRSMGCRIEK